MKKQVSNRLPYDDRLSFLWLIIGFVLVLFTYGMYRFTLSGLLSSVFLLRFMRTRRIGVGYLLMYLALAVASIISWWNTDPTAAVAVKVIMGIVVGFMYSVPFLLDRVLVGNFRGFTSTLIFPFALAAFEFLTMWPNPLTTYGSTAYSQFGNLYLTQIASITGLWGITFLVGWFGAMVNWLWEERMDWPKIRRGVAIYAGIMLVVILFGTLRLTFFLPESGTVRIHGIVESDYTREEFNDEIGPLSVSDPEAFRARVGTVHERYLEATRREAQAGAEIVVWPEIAIEGFSEDVAAVLAEAQEIARQEDIYLVVGHGSTDPATGHTADNKMVIFDPHGGIVVDQSKYGCLASNMYNFEIQTVDTPFGRIAGVICCDLDYPYVVRQISQKNVDILLVPSFEPSVQNLVAHAQMAPFRAIENGVSIFRPVSNGISMAIDPYGRTIGAMNYATASETVLVSQVPNVPVFTVYSVIGDSFGWLFVAGFLTLVVWAIYQRRTAVAAESEISDRPVPAN